jgi:hypothetical protein
MATLNSIGYQILSTNTVSSVVLRDPSGNFSANNPSFVKLSYAGGSVSGTASVVDFSSYAAANYMNFVGAGRNIGIALGGPFFMSYNVDWDSTNSVYKYTANGAAFALNLSSTLGKLVYFTSGTAGNTATQHNAVTWDGTGNVTIDNGDLSLLKEGKVINIRTGLNGSVGTGAVLVGGTVTVTTTAVESGDIILLSCTAAGGVQGFVRISAIVNATSFTITSSSVADTSTYDWVIIRPI